MYNRYDFHHVNVPSKSIVASSSGSSLGFTFHTGVHRVTLLSVDVILIHSTVDCAQLTGVAIFDISRVFILFSCLVYNVMFCVTPL